MPEPSQAASVLQQCLARLNAGDERARDELLRLACGRLQRITRRCTATCRNCAADGAN